MTDPGGEPVEVVDLNGRVLEVTTRSRMRAERLRHRCTYVAVLAGPTELLQDQPLDLDCELIVHQRAAWKDTYPSYWDLAFGGVCGVGEDWKRSASRELAEEAGIFDVPLIDLGPCRYEESDNRVVGRVFVTAWSGRPTNTDGEVSSFGRIRLGELENWVEERSVCPDSAQVVVPRLLALRDHDR